MKHKVMFLGGPETGNLDKNVWGIPDGYHKTPGGPITFPLREWVTLDPDGEENQKRKEFLEHVIKKASRNRFFKVEEVRPGRPPNNQASA